MRRKTGESHDRISHLKEQSKRLTRGFDSKASAPTNREKYHANNNLKIEGPDR